MLRSSLLLLATGWFASLAAPQIATAAIWSVEADCRRGDWTLGVELTGFGTVDASCIHGVQSRVAVDVGELTVTGGAIKASSVRTACELPTGSGSKFSLECEGRSEDSSGFELDEAVEIEVELEEAEDGDALAE